MIIKAFCKDTAGLLKDSFFRIWCGLVGLTLLSVTIVEAETPGQWSVYVATLLVCLLVLVKGQWVIDYFMGLKQAAPIHRRLVLTYFYLVTMGMAGCVIYTQTV